MLGFPLLHVGNGANIQECRITTTGPHQAAPHCVVDDSIPRGTSGGTALYAQNEMMGIGGKGQGTPGKHGPDDDLSRFVPIDHAIKYL